MWCGLPSHLWELLRQEFHNYINTLKVSDLASSLRSRAKQTGVYAISDDDGFVLHVGQDFEEKISTYKANMAQIAHFINGQIFYPVTPCPEKAVSGGSLFPC